MTYQMKRQMLNYALYIIFVIFKQLQCTGSPKKYVRDFLGNDGSYFFQNRIVIKNYVQPIQYTYLRQFKKKLAF